MADRDEYSQTVRFVQEVTLIAKDCELCKNGPSSVRMAHRQKDKRSDGGERNGGQNVS